MFQDLITGPPAQMAIYPYILATKTPIPTQELCPWPVWGSGWEPGGTMLLPHPGSRAALTQQGRRGSS